jgi:uncharacterized protein YggT (Ycf19 family)
MAWLDFILNLAALALWLNWLSIHSDPLARAGAASLISTLRKADPAASRRWQSLAALAVLLFFRGFFYWEFSPSLHWTPNINLGIITLYFRGDFFGRMLLFSILSFIFTLAFFYICVTFLSAVNANVPDNDPIQKLVRLHFKSCEHWPRVIKFPLPFFFGALGWFALHPILAWVAIAPHARTGQQLAEQSALIGVAAYLAWKYLIAGILVLHLLNSYIYFGNHSFWNFINASARNILYPLRWVPLRFGKMDFLPLVGIAVVFFVCEAFSRLPAWLPQRFYHLLPF